MRRGKWCALESRVEAEELRRRIVYTIEGIFDH
jgi:hypothetical protein